MQVLTPEYIKENTKLESLVQIIDTGTPEQMASLDRSVSYVEKKVFLDVSKDMFLDEDTWEYVYIDDFKFLVLNLFECYRVTKDIALDMMTTDATSYKVDDVSESKTRRKKNEMAVYRWIPCDEDTIASIMWYTQGVGIGTMTIDLSDVL